MKTTLLIAHRWKLLGWILTIPALIGGAYYLTLDNQEYLVVTVPEWLRKWLWIESFMSNSKVTELALIDELISVSLIAGLLLLTFSREKTEDEWISQVRLESLQWAVLVNSFLLIFFTMWTHGMPFFSIMVYNMYTPLLIFVARFHYVLHLKPLFSKN